MENKLTLEEARQIVAWLMRELELCAMGHELIHFSSENEELRKKQIEAWARVNATAIKALLQEAGLSTDWHSDRDIVRGDGASTILVTSHIPSS